MRLLSLLAILWAGPVVAEPYFLSVQGMCNADDGELELADVIFLTERGLDSHYFGCEWPEAAGRAILRGEPYVTTQAKCSGSVDSWQAVFEIVRQEDGSLRVFQESGGISPVRFFRCP